MTSMQFLELIVSVSVQAGVVVLAAHWLSRCAEDGRGQDRLWTLCFVLLLGLLIYPALFPHVRLLPTWGALERQTAAEIVRFETRLGTTLLLIWGAGSAVSGALFVYRSVQAARFVRRCPPVNPDLVSVEELLSSDGGDVRRVGGRTVRLVSSPAIGSPFCWQFHEPYIVIPESLLTFERDALRLVLRHELQHLRTGHPLQVFLQRVVEIAFWYHPMVWWASQQSALAREFRCDDAAAATRGDIVKYLQTLLTIVEQIAAEERTPTTLAFVRDRGMLAERARRLVRIAQSLGTAGPQEGRRVSVRSARGVLAVVAALVACVWIPTSVTGAPRSTLSPWPTWSAAALHNFGVAARDFEVGGQQDRLQELLEVRGTPAMGSRGD